jgi:hypothetical protein
MPRFDYDDIVQVSLDASAEFRPGAKAWIVGVFVDRDRNPFDWLPPGTIYTIEYEDGNSIDINESALQPMKAAT